MNNALHLQKQILCLSPSCAVTRDRVFRAIKRSDCLHRSGGRDPCHISSNPYMIMFGLIEILLSQIPDFDRVWWLSMVASAMSFTYSSVGLALGVAKVACMHSLFHAQSNFLFLFSWYMNSVHFTVFF